ncbi:MAG: hypothetical protein JSR26_03905 [Proteobacteria bacterium]|nr:hypothetical protein [Pseudomonadota bacterium]
MAASTQPFDVGLVIARLSSPLPGTLKMVAGSADFAAITLLRNFPAPCAYVLLARERAKPAATGSNIPGTQSRRQQIVTVTFGVVMALRNYRQLEGDALRNELRDQIAAVRAPLLGWTPPLPCAIGCELVQGDLTDYDAGMALWTDQWRTQHAIDNGVSP